MARTRANIKLMLTRVDDPAVRKMLMECAEKLGDNGMVTLSYSKPWGESGMTEYMEVSSGFGSNDIFMSADVVSESGRIKGFLEL